MDGSLEMRVPSRKVRERVLARLKQMGFDVSRDKIRQFRNTTSLQGGESALFGSFLSSVTGGSAYSSLEERDEGISPERGGGRGPLSKSHAESMGSIPEGSERPTTPPEMVGRGVLETSRPVIQNHRGENIV